MQRRRHRELWKSSTSIGRNWPGAGANVFIQMIFRDGFYHADPHPGNFLVLPNGKIGLLDAGMVGRIDDKFRRQIEDILMAAGDRDADRLTDAVTRVCGMPARPRSRRPRRGSHRILPGVWHAGGRGSSTSAAR